MTVAALLLGVIVAGVVVALRAAGRAHREPVLATEISSEGEGASARDGDVGEAPRSQRYTVQRLRILVVDDNPFIGRAVTRLLEAHEVMTAASGEAALSALELDRGYDAILYALAMRGMSGVDFAAAITRQHPDLRARMVFLINGTSTPETRRLLALSNVRWVAKPLAYAPLATCVSEVAAQHACVALPAGHGAQA